MKLKRWELAMEFLYRDKLPNPAVINERIRQFNHIIHGVSQWREPPLDTQWPILVKDNIDVSGLRATAGSYALKELKAEDAFCFVSTADFRSAKLQCQSWPVS